MRFDGTRVVVTGGARGIGRGIVDAFLARVRASWRPTCCATTSRRCRPRIRPAIACPSTPPTSQRSTRFARSCRSAVGLLGGVDVLVNNAGVQPDGPFLDVTPTDIDACLAVNVRAPMLLMRDTCRHLIDRGAPGSIVNIASANAFHNESPESIYNASKAALVALTKAVAHEVGHLGIRANCVAPGETITPEATRGARGRSSTSATSCAAICRRIPLAARGHAQGSGDGGAVPRERGRALHLRPDARRRRRGDRGRQVVRRRSCSATPVAGAPDHRVGGSATPRPARGASPASPLPRPTSSRRSRSAPRTRSGRPGP